MFQDFPSRALALDHQRPAARRPSDEARELLARYPNLSETELARLINLYRQLPALDMALMLSDEALAPKMDRFAAEHRCKVRPPFRHYAGLIGYAVLAVIGVAWAMSSAS
ncbi:MAG: hypothetical protein ACM3ZV_02220 [Bacillota bacterium]